MPTKYSQIPAFTIFEAKGGRFRKLDELYFDDLQSGFQSTWNPMFDATILTEVTAKDNPVSVEPAYITDPQSRLIKRNPSYEADVRVPTVAEEALGELWGSAQFDCGPEDYAFMVSKSIEALKTLYVLEGITGQYNDHVALENYVRSMIDAKVMFDRSVSNATTPRTTPKKPAKKAAKKIVKKATRKTVKKAVKKSPMKGKRK